jgi:hypothetical protein
VLLAVGLLAAATALAGCGLLPGGQQAAQPGAVSTPSTPPSAQSTSASIDATTKAAADASMTSPAPLGDQIKVPDVTGLDAQAAQDALKEARLDYILNWSGDAMAKTRRVVSQQPPAGSTVASGTRVTILAATGKGEGRPFPVFYYGTTAGNVFGLRCAGTVLTTKFAVPEGTSIMVKTMRMPMEVWLIDDHGRWTLLQQNFKSNGRWDWRGRGLVKVESDGDERLFRDYQLYIKTPNSTWWDVRYGFYTDAEILSLSTPAGSGT